MLTLEYYTYTQGATLQRALNAIAAFFHLQALLLFFQLA